MSPSLVMCTGMVTTISHVLTVSRHLHMLPPLLGKQPCLNFTVTFLFNPVAGFFELPVKNFAILLMVTIAFPEKKYQCNKRFRFNFRLQRRKKGLIPPFTNNSQNLRLYSLLLVIYFSKIKCAFLFKHDNNFSSEIAKSTHDSILRPSAANFFV